jgi:hypothetical protein
LRTLRKKKARKPPRSTGAFLLKPPGTLSSSIAIRPADFEGTAPPIEKG